ncbi:MAG: hypothetical protein ABIM44_01620 [candidate division WOR-3 bacterium]
MTYLEYLWAASFTLAITSIILLLLSEMFSASCRSSKAHVNNRLRRAAILVTILFLITVVLEVVITLGSMQDLTMVELIGLRRFLS